MTIFWIIFILCILLLTLFIILQFCSSLDLSGAGIVISSFIAFIFLIIAIVQPITLKNEAIRQEKEREQIIYQIDNLTEDSDKIKLNEWILTYNDWVNDINTSKEVYGWFSWYRDFDMTEHTIIDLV